MRRYANLTVGFERRALPVVVAALVACLATGVYLTVSDARYGGAGNVRGSPWAAIITLKHGVVALVLGLGLFADGLIARKLADTEAPDRGAAVARLDLLVKAMTVAGAAVLLLTAVAAGASWPGAPRHALQPADPMSGGEWLSTRASRKRISAHSGSRSRIAA